MSITRPLKPTACPSAALQGKRRLSGNVRSYYMRIEHVALWTDDLDHITRFYTEYFCASVTPRYVNAHKGFRIWESGNVKN